MKVEQRDKKVVTQEVKLDAFRRFEKDTCQSEDWSPAWNYNKTILKRFSKYITQAKVTSVYFKLHQEHECECLLWIEDY